MSNPWPAGPHQVGDVVAEVREVAPGQSVLFLDGMESSFLDLNAPEHLEFEYMQHLDAIVTATFADRPIRAAHLGGAGCALARAWDATHPGSHQLAVEWDAEIARIAREYFPLPKSPRLRIRTADARAALDGFPDGRWDVVVRDAFVQGEVPDHLTDQGMWEAMARVTAPGGVFAANLGDSGRLDRARREVRLALAVASTVIVIADPAVLKGRRFGNLVIGAGSVDIEATTRLVHGLAFPARVLHGSALRDFAQV